MVSTWDPAKIRGRAPENIRPFELFRWAPSVQHIPSGCLCTWVPDFGTICFIPDRYSTPAATVARYQCSGLRLKYVNASCPALRQHS